MCLSHKSTLNVVDSLGEGHDEQVKQWREELKDFIDVNNVSQFTRIPCCIFFTIILLMGSKM